MAAPTGIAAQLGVAAETTVGTRVTVSTFLPLISESIKRTETFTESAAIRANRLVMTSDEWNSGNVAITGDLSLELYTQSIRPLFKAMFGSESGTGPYTYRPTDLAGNSLTVQVGRPDTSGTVQPFTYGGMKVMSWEIACAAGEIATHAVTLHNCLVDETTGVGLAAASYATGLKSFKFSGASVLIAGTTVGSVSQMTINGDNMLEPKWFIASTQFSLEPRQVGLRKYGGAIQAEFESLTAYNRFINHTEAAIVANFTVPGASTSLQFTMNARFDGETPNVGGRGIVEQSLPFTCIASTSNDYSAIAVVYTT
jgi:hypothetical protein